MTRHVVRPPDVAHFWFNESQDDARNGTDSFSFRGDTLFSYSTPIAKRIRNKAGDVAYLVTTQTYSPTTSSRHLPRMRQALSRSATIFNVSEVDRGGCNRQDATEKNYVNDYRERIFTLIAQSLKARSRKEQILSEIEATVAEAIAFCEFLGYKKQDWSLDGMKKATVAELRAMERARKSRIKKEAAHLAKILEEEAKEVELWRVHDPETRLSYYGTRGPTALRLSADGTEVETSKGATVPIGHARRIYLAWMENDPSLAAFITSGASVGEYKITEVTDDAITIGCHDITRAECTRFAVTMGWISEAVAA